MQLSVLSNIKVGKMKIVKTKFLCKNSSQTVTKGLPMYVIDRFIEGRWYDGEYETLNFDDRYRLNGGWRQKAKHRISDTGW